MSFKLHNSNTIMDKRIQQLSDQVSRHGNIIMQSDGEFEINKQINTLLVSMVGGGGCGGNSTVNGNFLYGGGGGGSGGGYLKKPIPITHNHLRTTIRIKIGKGGSYSNPDGGDTILSIYNGDKLTKEFIGRGGKGAIGRFNKGGDGAAGFSDLLTGSQGNSGAAALTTSKTRITGGNGASSLFSKGGLGGYQDILSTDTEKDFINPTNKDNPKGMDGSQGSGGGGSADGIDPTLVGKGGDGFIIIEY